MSSKIQFLDLSSQLNLGVRVAYYNPRQVLGDSFEDLAGNDTSLHYTGGVRYVCPSAPIVLFGEYTHSQEDAASALNNDRLEFAAQVNF